MSRRIAPDLRGGGFALCAVGWFLFGLAIINGVSGNPANAPHMKIPEPIRIMLWLGPASLAAVAIWVRGSWRTLALVTLVIGPIVRTASYLWLWILSLAGDEGGRPSGWYTAALHAAMIGIVVLVAAIPDRAKDDAQ